mgnify:CR=1 FL=1
MAVLVGATEALHLLALALLGPGDEALMLEPVFDVYLPQVALAGGVAANSGLRTALQQEAEVQGWEVFIPEFQFCTDNAAMVAMTAHFQLEAGDVATQLVSPDPRLKLS